MTFDPIDWPTRDLLAHRAAVTPQRTALIDDETGSRWSFRALDQRVDRVAHALETVAIGDDRRETRLGVCMNTRPAFVIVFFAAMRIGTTVVPLNVRETPDELAAKVDRTGLAAVVCEHETEAVALEITDRATGDDRRSDAEPSPVLSVDEPAANRVRRLYSTDDADATSIESPAIEYADLERDDTLLLMFTSGTAGEPKAVRLTVGNLIASATASAFRLGVDPGDRWLCCLPMYHMGGLAPVLRSTLYGTTVVVQREFDHWETQDVLERYGCSGVSLVPTMCKRLLDAGWEPADALRFVLLGGAPASSELLERCRAAGVPVHPTYGMTETASQIATATPEETATHEGTVGQPLLFADVTVVDEDGDPVPTGEPGELVVAGPTVTPGYLDEGHTEAAFDERGLRTGDIGYADDDGRLWVLNRRSDRIVSGGENVDPGEVLEALRSHPTVDDAAVVGLEDAEWGERVAALVVPAGGTDEIDLESLLARCDERLAGFKRPKTLGVADSLPRTASGTVDRGAVRDELLESGTDVSDLPSR